MTASTLASLEQIAQVLKTKNSFFLTTASPDGDSIGSMLALGLALKKRNKKVQIFSPEPFPDNLQFLDGMDMVIYKVPAQTFDALIVMDTGSSHLLFEGDRKAWAKISELVIDIDHHPDNDSFGNINFVHPESASTGEIIYQILSHVNWEITSDIAEALLTALMADTGAFRYPNVTPDTLTFASDLVAKGASNGKVARKLYATATPDYAKLLGHMFVNLNFEMDGKLVWSVLTQKDFKGSLAADTTADKMVEQLDILKDVKAYALLRQMEDGKIKVSLRSRDKLPVNKIAAKFGGGGHLQAAGCQLDGDIKVAEKKIVDELRGLLTADSR